MRLSWRRTRAQESYVIVARALEYVAFASACSSLGGGTLGIAGGVLDLVMTQRSIPLSS